MITRTSGYLSRSLQTQTGKIHFVNENVDDPYRTIFDNVIIEPFREQ